MKHTFPQPFVLLGLLLPFGASAAVVLTDFTFQAGSDAQANSNRGFAWQGRATGSHAIAIGRFTEAANWHSVALGFGAWTSDEFGVAIGASRDAAYNGDPWMEPTSFRQMTTHAGSQAVAIGSGAAAGGDSVAIGYFSQSDGASTAIGSGPQAFGNSLAFASNWNALATNESVALNATAENASFAAVGGTARDGSIAIGDGTLASQGNVALGRLNRDTRRDGAAITNDSSPLDPLFEIGNPVLRTEVNTYWDDGQLISETYEYLERQNAFAIYRDNVVRFEGPVQIKSSLGYVTLAPAGATQAVGDTTVLTLPATGEALLSDSSDLSATKLTGQVPMNSLPPDLTQLGATIDLDPASAETTGNLPWSRIGGKPATLAENAYPDAISVNRETINGTLVIATPLRIKPQGDIPMFGQ